MGPDPLIAISRFHGKDKNFSPSESVCAPYSVAISFSCEAIPVVEGTGNYIAKTGKEIAVTGKYSEIRKIVSTAAIRLYRRIRWTVITVR